MLKEALELLAAPAQEQVRWMDSLEVRVEVDELALNYGDIAPAAGFMCKMGEITEAQRDCGLALLHFLEEMSGEENAALWSPDALASSSKWDEVRRRAKACLDLLRNA